ncbi:Kinetochore protein spc25 [Rhizoctonia solani AG-1 IB]|uniref:Kinetochore protein SPC25 n=1 Tax=Thanatephorus cucumeris (strain AG1-IB / isolate 7/3/14) TaxID=1108050 RepID=M5C2P1_THACB|nr:Kinetochore protein spc25 [Rhizoctonia solani AG-1 IB]
MNAEIEQFRVDEMNLMKTLKREQEEKAEAEAKLAEYNAQLKDVEENRAAVDVELEDLRSRTDKLKLEKSQDLAKLEHQVALNEPEAQSLSDLLKWTVEGVQRDVLRIKFTHIDESDWAREFSFVVDLSERTYKGVFKLFVPCFFYHCFPILAASALGWDGPLLIIACSKG